jgi:hypothetical protein
MKLIKSIIALLAETANDLQAQLDAFYEYFNLWKLKVNADKTKVMVFGNGRLPQNFIIIHRHYCFIYICVYYPRGRE